MPDGCPAHHIRPTATHPLSARLCPPRPLSPCQSRDGWQDAAITHHDFSYNPRTGTVITLASLQYTELREYTLAGKLLWRLGNPNKLLGHRSKPSDHFNSLCWDADTNVIYLNDATEHRSFAFNRSDGRLLWCVGQAPCWPLEYEGRDGHGWFAAHHFSPLGGNRFLSFLNGWMVAPGAYEVPCKGLCMAQPLMPRL